MAAAVALAFFAVPGHAADAGPAAKATASAPAGDALLGRLSLSSQREPITIIADSLEFDYRARVLAYKGNVVVTQADLKLEADTLRVALDDASSADAQIKEVAAAGNVRMNQGTRRATAGRAVFDQSKRIITLSEDAVLHDGDNQVSGDRVVVYLDEERSVVDGGNRSSRVKAILFPNRDPQAKKDPAP